MEELGRCKRGVLSRGFDWLEEFVLEQEGGGGKEGGKNGNSQGVGELENLVRGERGYVSEKY